MIASHSSGSKEELPENLIVNYGREVRTTNRSEI